MTEEKNAVERIERELIRGWLHRPQGDQQKHGLVITHGAGSNCNSPLLVAVADAFAADGYPVLRCDLPYRQLKPIGPPIPGGSAKDREGLRLAALLMREMTAEVVLGGHSYGGRQSSMLAAEDPDVAEMLLLLSYPLHPPRKPEQLRTGHFEKLRTPALFAQGTRDSFGTIEELQAAMALIPAPTRLVAIEKAGHELGVGAVPVIVRESAAMLKK